MAAEGGPNDDLWGVCIFASRCHMRVWLVCCVYCVCNKCNGVGGWGGGGGALPHIPETGPSPSLLKCLFLECAKAARGTGGFVEQREATKKASTPPPPPKNKHFRMTDEWRCPVNRTPLKRG